MALTNYWWLLIWIFAAGGIMAVVVPKQKKLFVGKWNIDGDGYQLLLCFYLILSGLDLDLRL